MPLSTEEDVLRQALAGLRSKAGLSQRALSEKLGMHPMVIGKIERGERSVSVLELVLIARVLSTSATEILGALNL